MSKYPCVECGSDDLTLTGGAQVYSRIPHLHSKKFWVCKCGAYVGCHAGTENAYGSPAGPATRKARMAAHNKFDPFWKSNLMSRADAYVWLAGVMGIPVADCHISQMNHEAALRVVELCTTLRQEYVHAARELKKTKSATDPKD